MVWRRFPWDPLREMARIQGDLGRLFGESTLPGARREFPPVRVWTGDEGLRLVARMPGVDPASIDVVVEGDTLTVKGERPAPGKGEERTWHRRERGAGRFARRFALPFEIDAQRVEASYLNGLLNVTLPRSEAARPKKIAIATA